VLLESSFMQPLIDDEMRIKAIMTPSLMCIAMIQN
jgi:hypothetical protein